MGTQPKRPHKERNTKHEEKHYCGFYFKQAKRDKKKKVSFLLLRLSEVLICCVNNNVHRGPHKDMTCLCVVVKEWLRFDKVDFCWSQVSSFHLKGLVSLKKVVVFC